MSDVTYGQLHEALRSLGFSVRVVEPNNWEYRHADTGALFFVPVFSPEKPVLARHLVAVRAVLQGHGIDLPLELAGKAIEAS